MKTTPKTEAKWIAQLDTKPDQTMKVLVEQYAALACHEAAKYLENPEDVKDCVNETFAEVYCHRSSYDPEKGSLATWIGTIARNRAISVYRKAVKRPASIDAEGISTNVDNILEAEQTMDVEQAISQLSETDQKIIRMKYYEDMSISEIAESLHIPYETAKKRHTRSIKKLRHTLLLVLIIAALIMLAACGVIKVLRHFGVLPGYGLVPDPDPVCYLLAEPVELDTDLYHVAVTEAKLYNGKLEMEFDFHVPKQDFEVIYLDEEHKEIGIEPPLSFRGELTYPDGTLLPSGLFNSIGVGDFFFGSGTLTTEWRGEELAGLVENEELEFLLHVRDIVFDGKPYTEDVTLPFRLEPVGMETIEDYPHLYDEETGGIVLDANLDGETLSLDVYPMAGGSWEYSMGLTRDFYGLSVGERDVSPVTITDENGQVYYGEFPSIEAEGGTIPPYEMSTMDYYFRGGAGFSTFLFQGVKPGTYTLTLPYVYLLAFDKDMGTLRWNLEDCTFSDDVVEIPGGKMYTTSVRTLDESWNEVYNDYYDCFWEVRVRCELDREDMTVVEANFPCEGREPKRTLASKLDRLFHGADPYEGTYSVFGETPGRLDRETGELVYQLYCSEEYRASHDLSRVECGPTSPLMDRPICYRYDHPVELQFEVR